MSTGRINKTNDAVDAKLPHENMCRLPGRKRRDGRRDRTHGGGLTNATRRSTTYSFRHRIRLYQP